MSFEVRPVKQSDLSDLKAVIDSSEFFPSKMLDDMILDYFENPESEAIWLTVVDSHSTHRAIAVAFCPPEQMTEGTFNLYLIAVHKNYQGTGNGRQLMDYIEDHLKAAGHRILLVETSGLPEFKRTRKFYDDCSYVRTARIKEFYAAGEDKVIFWKK